MKAIVYRRYGGPEVFEFVEVEKPSPKANEVLIKIVATSVTQGDRRLRVADPVLARLHNGLLKPKKYPILGFECSGIVEKVGKRVTTIQVGEAVVAFAGFSFGCYAEYICINTDGEINKGLVARKPSNIDFVEGAVCPTGGVTALSFLKDLGIEDLNGKEILILGASGSVGSFAVQIAKHYGAVVTGVSSTANCELVQNLGADFVVDYKVSNVFELNKIYDRVFDAVGLYSKSEYKKVLSSEGRFASVKGDAKSTKNVLDDFMTLVEKGAVKPVIDKIYSWEEIVEAHNHIDTGHKVGNIGLRVLETD